MDSECSILIGCDGMLSASSRKYGNYLFFDVKQVWMKFFAAAGLCPLNGQEVFFLRRGQG